MRSVAPLVLLPVALAALLGSDRVDSWLGEAAEEALVAGGFALSLLGLAVRWLTVGFVPAGTSGRGTAAPRADRLNTSGAYSVVRNPLYLGNFLAILGVVVAVQVWWFVLLATLAYWLYVERVVAAEEAYLAGRHGEAYAEWAARTPAFLPRLSGWRTPDMPFSLRTVLRREYPGLMAVVVGFLLVDMVEDMVAEAVPPGDWIVEEAPLIAIFLATALVYVVLRTLKKRTRLLRVSGR